MYDLYIRPWGAGELETAEEKLRNEHIARLGERYTRIFSEKDVERHLAAL
ncbi:MAG: hypothetical protein H6R37_480, partial [Deltaproteobacteria bacterium]|nr:hypothetical protein [Deltaproteobacteria bacterium]